MVLGEVGQWADPCLGVTVPALVLGEVAVPSPTAVMLPGWGVSRDRSPSLGGLSAESRPLRPGWFPRRCLHTGEHLLARPVGDRPCGEGAASGYRPPPRSQRFPRLFSPSLPLVSPAALPLPWER